ncbi:MAG TPA: RimK family protein [Alphaproteobacteria bacterium]|nr:RimK family protein [Alphaproteobacteria bacterium]
MKKYIIVTDKPNVVLPKDEYEIISPAKFISYNIAPKKTRKFRPKVINLCNNFDYLSKGYYVSLLAEAMGLSCIPHISNIVTLNWKKNYDLILPEINTLLQKHFNEPEEDPLLRTYTTYFGRHENPKLEPITRRLFDVFRFPVLTFELKFVSGKGWVINKVDSGSVASLSNGRLEKFQQALDRFTGSAWRFSGANKKAERHWIAILHNPDDPMGPSDKKALNKFIKIGKQMGLWVELITKADFSMILEYDALFIRETTAINNHTYRFAAKAESEDIPCIDDTQSIIRCCNKVFLHKLLEANGIETPKTTIIDKVQKPEMLVGQEFPAVLKIPDGSFSHGVFKVKNAEEFCETANKLLKKSEMVLCQEFVESEFDWRIGVLNGQAIYALRYYMAKGHWQIYNHNAKAKSKKEGDHDAVALEDVPSNVIDAAVKSSNLIGKGLYGVDLKQRPNGDVIVIEVNDNPSIDSGVEDTLLGDELYRIILQHLVTLIEAQA